MGARAQTSQEAGPGDFQQFPGDHPLPRVGKPGRRASPKEVAQVVPVLVKTLRHFLPGLPGVLRRLPDPRRPGQLYYPKETLIWSAILIFLLALKSRRQFRLQHHAPAFVANLNALAQSRVECASHDDTIAYYLARLPPESAEELPVYIVRRLIRMKALDRWRLHGAFLVAVDGTGHRFFRQRHCPHCLTRRGSDGRLLYFHPILEAKLVTASGLVFSMATEFLENTDPHAERQDCELKAFSRLAAKLKSRFPRLRVILLGDSLYACQPVFDLCETYRWHFLFTFKEGALPALFADFAALRDYTPKNRLTHRIGETIQRFAWVNDLLYQGHRLSAFECREQQPDGEHYFAYLSDIPVGCRSVVTLCNQGGRLRWKLENQGFNIQKNHGYQLEHSYCSHPWAAKNFYYFLQVAHAIHQLMTKGSLLRPFDQLLGSFRNFLCQLAEAFGNCAIPSAFWDTPAFPTIQIRLDSS